MSGMPTPVDPAVRETPADAPVEARFQLDYAGFSLDVDLTLPGRGVTALFGHSGSGKTTLLRLLAGLERARRGRLVVGGEVWQDDAASVYRPTHQREIGYVFQEASLFPHLNVRRNIAYGMKRAAGGLGQEPLDQAVALLGIAHLLDRSPATLSGGERQRAAIARALATRPKILLMDEPLAALDNKRKEEILPYLQKLHDELRIPVVYVTHSPDEVARLADHLVMLDAGRVQAAGATTELMTRTDLSLAHGDVAGALLVAMVTGFDPAYGLTHCSLDGGTISLTQPNLHAGDTVRLRIQARDVSLALQDVPDTTILNTLPVTVTDITDDTPGQAMVGLDARGTRLLARITRKSVDALSLRAGMQVYARIKGVAVIG